MIEGHLIPITMQSVTAITADGKLYPRTALPTHFFGATPAFNGEIVDAEIFDPLGITGDNTNRYDITLCKGTVAAPIVVSFLRLLTGVDITAVIPKLLTINGQGASGSTTLNGAVTAAATALVLTAVTSFPGVGKFWVKVDDELMYVTAGQGTTTFTVARGQQGTKAAAHATGATCVLWHPAAGRRVTTGDVLHVLLKEGGSATTLGVDFSVTAWVADKYQYAAETNEGG